MKQGINAQTLQMVQNSLYYAMCISLNIIFYKNQFMLTIWIKEMHYELWHKQILSVYIQDVGG